MAVTGGKRKHLSHILRFAVAAGALYLAFRGENFREVADVVLGLNLWIFAAAVGIYIVSQFIFVARWYLLLGVQGIRIGFFPALRLHFLGLFYNNCLPSSVGGDFLRAYYVTHHTDKKLEAALSVFVDRAVGVLGIGIMAFGFYWFLPAGGGMPESGAGEPDGGFMQKLAEYQWLLFVAAGVLFIAAIGLISNEKGRNLLRRFFAFVRSRGVYVFFKTQTAVKVYYSHKLAVFAALLLTFCCQGVFILGLWLIGWEIGMRIDPKYYFIFFSISWLLGVLPISVGGAGIMEWWLKVMFITVCGVSNENALALALCQRLIWLIGSLPGVAIHLAGAHLPKDFFVDCKEPAD